MRALALLCIFVIAKLLILAGRPIQFSLWMPIAYFWQDVLVALAFGLLDWTIKRQWFGWALYGVCVGYVTINVAVERVLSSPLTWPMVGATRGALSDSIKHHATLGALAMMSLVAGAGTALPVLLRRFPRSMIPPRAGAKSWSAAIIFSMLVVAFGPLATSRTETIGLGRNPIMALVTTALPRISARPSDIEVDADWRESSLTDGQDPDLSWLSGAARGRNVVLISLESTGAQYLLPYGAICDPMPNLSKLARESVLFENAYAVYPESIKGLYSVLCSRYPAIDTSAETYSRLAAPSFASALGKAGYHTALFHSGRFMYLGMDAIVENRGYEILEDAGAIGGNHESSFGVDEPSTVSRALRWIDSLSTGDRFFLTYLPIAGHHPYDTPEPGPFPEQVESDRYLNALYYSDAAVGALLDGLRARGLYDRTVFVIYGDHGEAFGQHAGNYGHSFLLYDENIHVPYLIAAPGLIRDEVRVVRAISLIDCAPTALDLLDLQSPPEFQGSSALESRVRMALFFTDYSLGLMGLRDKCWKYIYELDSGRSKLFDLCADSSESKDLSSQQGERVSAYRELLLRWSASQKALIRNQSDRPQNVATRRQLP